MNYKVDDILSCSWGYDQTNVDFYQVVGLTPKSIKIRKIDQYTVSSETGTDLVAPVPNAFTSDKVMTKLVDKYDSVKISSYSSAYKWDGKPQYQTAVGYGH